MKKMTTILAGPALACLAWLSLPVPPAHAACSAPCTKAQITTDINANWPDNTSGGITPALLRSTVLELVNSYVDVNGSSSYTCPTHQFLTAIATLSAFSCAQPAIADVSGWGTGVAAALGVNIGSAGAPVLFNGALGTPSSGAVATTLLTGALQAAQEPAHTGDMTNSAGSLATIVTTTNGVSFGPYATASRGQLPGITTNTPASAGNIGELVINSANGASSTATISNGSPAIITQTGWKTIFDPAGQNTNYTALPVNFTTTGGLPTGLTVGVTYYIIPIDANTYNVATTPANAFAGTKVNTSSAGSGTHTAIGSVTLTNNTIANLLAVQLTAGEWDVAGIAAYQHGASTTSTFELSGISTTSVTFAGFGTFINNNMPSGTVLGAVNQSYVLPMTRLSLSATTIVYVLMDAGFGVSTMAGLGQIRATRIH
jgi:hypothetical protein